MADVGHRSSRRRRCRHPTNGDEDVLPKRPRSSLKDGEEGKDVATIQHLPPEMLLHIISFLTLPDLLRLGQTCRYLHEACDSEAAWHHLCTPLLSAAASARPCKRAAILNYTKGLCLQSLGCRQQQAQMASIQVASAAAC
ncbi:F-box only protein 24-like [Aquila chrysaetos chrysaetos]|uniref:F-box only protein 24-like n=1 Tax=Aquila chrysaetos chrysaetos TaxID=223781 RepID=UPI001B7D4431|nr:F-box only protein 24-like [Aquila chrysaetos chrysaetos]